MIGILVIICLTILTWIIVKFCFLEFGSKLEISKYMALNETISIGQLYERVYKEKAEYYNCKFFLDYTLMDTKNIKINRSTFPFTVTRIK